MRREAAARAPAQPRAAVGLLERFIRFPTVSTDPKHSEDIRSCAVWLASQLRRIGMTTAEVVATPGHPIVFAEWTGAPGAPTVLMYGHYDVQPPGPLKDWRTPPFEPAVRGGAVYGRGASDNKGPIVCHIMAHARHFSSRRRLPVNVRCLYEGEEEIGSPNLASFLLRNRKRLHADAALISDTRMLGPGRPTLVYSLRGGVNAEIDVRGPRRDLHSGGFGGAVLNPLQVLAQILAGLHDERERVTIPGFYDRVRNVGDAEREFMQRNGPPDEEILASAGVEQGTGEHGYSMYERTTIRPALTVNGVSGGYSGPGGMSVIPSRASAKLNLRLVPDQEPAEIADLLQGHIEALTPEGVRVSVRARPAARPATISRRLPAMRAAARACRRAFGTSPVFIRSGGSIPVVSQFAGILQVPTVLMGFALPNDGMHGPNERFRLENLAQGTVAIYHFLDLMAGGAT